MAAGNGIAALIDGTTQICQASRPMKDAEKESLKTKRSLDAVETPVALDALAVYVNKDNPISPLTMDQIGENLSWARSPIGKMSAENRATSFFTGARIAPAHTSISRSTCFANKDFPPNIRPCRAQGASWMLCKGQGRNRIRRNRLRHGYQNRTYRKGHGKRAH